MGISFETGPNSGHGKRAILIAGPTASGKSALAIELAKRVDGVVVNADSMQLYEDLRLVSARPSIEEETEVPHRLYGVLPSSEAFSTGAWLRRMSAELETIWSAGQVPVLVGGTGLYFKALTEGFAELPEIPDAVREQARLLADAEGVPALKEALVAAGDEQAAETLNDPQRLARALEVILATGQPLTRWQKEQQSSPVLQAADCLCLVLAPPRNWLHERIAKRSKLMLSEDGIREVKVLLAQKLSYKLPAMRAIGVKEIGAFLTGKQDNVETEYRLIVATRQYAKRQETWFRNQMPDWQRLDPSREIDADAVVVDFLTE
ncbi:tRNA (adenosine(37)-N6)-dimethylallyltransferase MiaA [Labrenzia sp. PHM005]|uniref:tRNA (adenosine(37)-N6)-dimethylallyltransferase MiaA n=1 Tax=Labrenzia sp. PHM005 TaxID=2590016 RepID=UPI0011405ECA|nr:tRNA (adenosine(37)-N6)-dimethylallyltransferase MiaA [Labrenzia sp. PHM005]QDG76881.1 tRNA (adenosine(37)-N6)-dimethylallyltransferase MiaA [Labrenzia sp. PHM005]